MQKKSKKEIVNVLMSNKEKRENFSFRVTVDRADKYRELSEEYKKITGTTIKLGEIGDILMDEMNSMIEQTIESISEEEKSQSDSSKDSKKIDTVGSVRIS